MSTSNGSNFWFWMGALFVAVALVHSCQDVRSRGRTASTTNSGSSTRADRIKSQFSAWDGSHRALVSAVKEQMNDPGSFEHVETRYVDKSDHLLVIMRFRGRNGFGGVVTQTVSAKIDMSGNIIHLIGL